MYEPEEKIPKYKTEVQIQFDDGASLLGFVFLKQMQRVSDDGASLLGFVFLKQMQRVSDLLNDPRQFLPFQKSDGPIVYIRKATIANVIELKEQDEYDAPSDPYEILGVSPGVSDADLKHAFHDLCNHYHPDRVQPLDLPTDLSDFANSRLIRIIDAYRRVTSKRHCEVGNGQDKSSSADPVFTRV